MRSVGQGGGFSAFRRPKQEDDFVETRREAAARKPQQSTLPQKSVVSLQYIFLTHRIAVSNLCGMLWSIELITGYLNVMDAEEKPFSAITEFLSALFFSPTP
jgi:hypothetical protein